MPKISIDYSNCCIYKIEHIKNDSLIYVGHTTNFKQRKSQHKSNCINDEKKKYNIKLYQMIRGNGGWEMFKMIEVEKYPCNDRREAEKKENELMKELKANMNKNRSFITNEERLEQQSQYYKDNKDTRKETIKQYREYNKDKIKDERRQYYENNKETIKEKNKEYNEKNKEKVKEREKNFRERNKEKIKDKRKQYYEDTKETTKNKTKQYYEDNKENIKYKTKQ